MSSSLRIDAHHHLWHYRRDEYAWIDHTMAVLQRDFQPPELERSMDAVGIEAAVAVQARQSLAETEFLLEMSKRSPKICGVVGWVPLFSSRVGESLDLLKQSSTFVGAREIVQAEAAGFMDQPDFDRGIAALTSRNLTYDLLIRANQLAEALRLVDRHPTQLFVLDHAAKPSIRTQQIEPWASELRELARRENVVCKLSGFVTEADWATWTPEQFKPYLDVCTEAFTPGRLMAGSDWPVCLLASSYAGWWQVLERYFANFTEHEREQVFGQTAVRSYALRPSLETRTGSAS